MRNLGSDQLKVHSWIPILNYAIFFHGVFLLSNKVDGSWKNSSRIRHLFHPLIHNFRA